MRIEENRQVRSRENEKGAAMVMALLLSFLLLIASAGLLLESSLNAHNVTDATAEQQAYNAAESGIQSAVDILRGNKLPNPLFNVDPTHKDNKINFVKALRPSQSNVTTSGLDATPRLSRWVGYTATHTVANDVVRLGEGTYAPQTGHAYSLEISDPDNTGSLVTYTTEGRFADCDRINPSNPMSDCADMPYPHTTYVGPLGSVRITYLPVAIANMDVSADPAPVNFGKFKVEVTGAGAVIPAFNRFDIKLRMTAPYRANKVMRGWIETNSLLAPVPKVIVDSQTFTLQGSIITMNFNSGTMVNFPDATPQRVGYEAQLALGENTINATMTSPEPVRLLIRSTGYGPRGAMKRLEAIIQKNFFNGLGAPATLTLVGPDSTTSPSTTFTFNPGSSNVTTYSGDDVVTTDIIPPIGTTNPNNLQQVQASVDGQPPFPFNGNIIGTPSNVSNDMPDWLMNPAALDAALHSLAGTAQGSADPTNTTPLPSPYRGTRFYPQGQTPTTFGNNATGTGITFCDGDVTFTGPGGGILVVTGTLTLHGNFDFKGLIIVTGQGGVLRSGGGNGVLEGNVVVAPYLHSRIEDTTAIGTTFLAPNYDLSGGGSSTITYNSSSVAAGLTAVSNFVLGVLEK